MGFVDIVMLRREEMSEVNFTYAVRATWRYARSLSLFHGESLALRCRQRRTTIQLRQSEEPCVDELMEVMQIVG